MSYAPGHDGPPVAELPHIDDMTCEHTTTLVDWYWGERWGDAANAQEIVTCECGSYRTRELTS
ncbi:hypothetical protein SEA_BADDON_7 [Gordonia phage Baddon]|nr:hypothetical protein SEA_BADDON_7 [Gordonia phage Baddon]